MPREITEYHSSQWKSLLQANELAQFNAIWSLSAPWFEPPNKRRHGWSGVIQHTLQSTDKKSQAVFIKRQENHTTRTFKHPIFGIATFEKEFNNIIRFNQYHIPTLDLIYYGKKQAKKNVKAILITASLVDFHSLDNFDLHQFNNLITDRQNRYQLIETIAAVIQLMHQHRLQHNCLYPKHIFISQSSSQWQVRFIDLEKAKRPWFKYYAVMRDLTTLNRRDNLFSIKDRIVFLKAYQNEKKLSAASKKLWKKIAKDYVVKNKTARKKNR